MRRCALFLAGVLTGVLSCYVAAIAAIWRHLTKGSR